MKNWLSVMVSGVRVTVTQEALCFMGGLNRERCLADVDMVDVDAWSLASDRWKTAKGEGSKKERRTMATSDQRHLCAFGGMMMGEEENEDEKFDADARAAPTAQKEAD